MTLTDMIFNTTTHTYIFQTVYTYALTAHRHCSPCYCAYINLHIYMARSIQIYFLYFLLDSFILSWVPYSIHSLTSENFWYFYFAYFFSKTVFILHGTFVSASISAPKFSRVVEVVAAHDIMGQLVGICGLRQQYRVLLLSIWQHTEEVSLP